MRDDHAPLIGGTSGSVPVAVHDLWNWALPIVACHLDEVSLCGRMGTTIVDIGEGHGCLAAACQERVGKPHGPRLTIVAFTAAPRPFGGLVGLIG